VEAALKATLGEWAGKAYRGLDRLVYYTSEGKEEQALRARTYLDVSRCRLRLEIAPEGAETPAVLVYTQERLFLRLPEGREAPAGLPL
jgi:hypothetical protein